jgi:Ca-activated chloride channel family protein
MRAPVDLALVIDTSGSMEGDKIQNARAAAKTIVERLHDGDVVSIDTFSNDARNLVRPTVIDMHTRARILGAIQELGAEGATDMFDGLTLAESHIAEGADARHAVRRIVMISDGIANVGPSSPAALGDLAARSLMEHAQVTSLGVGTDYDEQTLNALAFRTSGRLFHISDPAEMVSTIQHEVDLLGQSLATDAFVEIVPAPGVSLGTLAIGDCTQQGDGSLRIPLGTLFSGQHREALLRVSFSPMEGTSDVAPHALASVRLHFRDPQEGDLERVQELVAHVTPTSDAKEVAVHANARTRSILAVQDAARLEMVAAQSMNHGDFAGAQAQLAQAETKLKQEAANATTEDEKTRLNAAAASVASARASATTAASAPPPVQADAAKAVNAGGMSNAGY